MSADESRYSRRQMRAEPRAGRPKYSLGYIGSCGLPLLLFLAIVSLQPSLLAIARDQLFDAYQRASPRAWNRDLGVRIVDIDERSLHELGQWPWPRTRLAELLEHLRRSKVAAVGFDVAFAEPDRTSFETIAANLSEGEERSLLIALSLKRESYDNLFAKAIRAMPVVLGTILTDHAAINALPRKFGLATIGGDAWEHFAAFKTALPPLQSLADAATGLGALNWVPDADLTVRRVPLLFTLNGAPVPSLALETLRAGLGATTYLMRPSQAFDSLSTLRIGDIKIETDSRADLRLRYSPHEPRRFISAAAVLADRVGAEELEDRLILVGSSAAGLGDIRATPVDAAMPGIEIQAQALENILGGTQLHRPEWSLGAEIGAGVALAILAMLLLPLLPTLASSLLTPLLVFGVVSISWVVFRERGLLFDPIAPSILPAVVYLAGSAWLFRSSQRERRWINDAFGRFVSPQVVERLASNPSTLALGGETRDLTILFCDLQGFTGLVEKMDARRLTLFVNSYLSPMSHIILSNRGTIGKYIGDAIMAFWNAPLNDERHAENSVAAAIKMIDALPQISLAWNERFISEQRPLPAFKCGIGVATGPCAVGNFGSDIRFEYSAMGDTVNIAARLEAATRLYGLDMLAAEATMRACPNVRWLEVDIVRLKGKEEATRIYTPLISFSNPEERMENDIVSDHDEMLVAYRSGDFLKAGKLSKMVAAFAPERLQRIYAVYDQRCSDLAGTPPGIGWNGITDLPK